MVTLSARSHALSSLSSSPLLKTLTSHRESERDRVCNREREIISELTTMDVYGLSSPDLLRIDDLLDFSNEDIFSGSSSGGSTAATSSSSFPPPPNPSFHHHHHHLPSSADHHSFLQDICVPSDDAAHLEWLSQFVDDSFADFPANPLGGIMTSSVKTETSFPGKSRSKRSRIPAAFNGTWAPMPLESDHQQIHAAEKFKPKKEQSGGGGGRHQSSSSSETTEGGGLRRCTHCASEKTPQWRTGPLGPKTLCNACGVRFKSGRLVPEYRPASSPTFVLTQHSNSHRKVMELRRQKEVMRQPPQVQLHHHHHPF